MTHLLLRMAKRSGLIALGFLFAAFVLPGAAMAGVATSGAVLLDPFDPVPEIQFQHFGGYGCDTGCGGYDRCDDGCGGHRRHACEDNCGGHRRHGCDDDCTAARHPRHDDCDDGCETARHPRHDGCDDGCETASDAGPPDGAPTPDARPPCEGRCNVTEHWQRDWRNGNHFGQEWYDRGYRERDNADGHRPGKWHRPDHDAEDNDEEDPPVVTTPVAPAKPDKH